MTVLSTTPGLAAGLIGLSTAIHGQTHRSSSRMAIKNTLRTAPRNYASRDPSVRTQELRLPDRKYTVPGSRTVIPGSGAVYGHIGLPEASLVGRAVGTLLHLLPVHGQCGLCIVQGLREEVSKWDRVPKSRVGLQQ